MFTIQSEQLQQQLVRAAELENQSVETFLAALLSEYKPPKPKMDIDALMAAFAELTSGMSDVEIAEMTDMMNGKQI